jgi:hypothetical protein
VHCSKLIDDWGTHDDVEGPSKFSPTADCPCGTSHSVSSLGPTIVRPRPTEIRTRISAVRVMLRRDNRSTTVLSPNLYIYQISAFETYHPPRPLGIHHAVIEAFWPTAGHRRLQNQPPVLLSEPLQSFDVSKAVSFNIGVFLLHNPCLYNLCSFYALLPWTPRVCRVSTLRFREYMYLYYSCAVASLITCLLLIGMRGSVLQQNFHHASNMHFEELCLVVCICLFSLLFHHSLAFSPRPPFSHYFSCET